MAERHTLPNIKGRGDGPTTASPIQGSGDPALKWGNTHTAAHEVDTMHTEHNEYATHTNFRFCGPNMAIQ